MSKITSIFIVSGDTIMKDFSNVQSIDTTIIPNIGDEIYLRTKGYCKVHRRIINYSNVEDYDLKEEGRGKEMIYVFI